MFFRTTAILTDTPVREAIEAEKRHAAQRRPAKPQPAKKRLFSPGPAAMPLATTAAASPPAPAPSAEDDSCLVCCEPFSNSLPGEEWVQCIFCYRWSHEMCTEGGDNYICHMCDE